MSRQNSFCWKTLVAVSSITIRSMYVFLWFQTVPLDTADIARHICQEDLVADKMAAKNICRKRKFHMIGRVVDTFIKTF